MKINGKTPEEIINATRRCLPQDEERCWDCAYSGEICCYEIRISDIVSLIQQLKRERDAAAEDLRTMGERAPCCETCFYNGTSEDEEPCANCCAGYIENRWQWRGAEEGLSDEQNT